MARLARPLLLGLVSLLILEISCRLALSLIAGPGALLYGMRRGTESEPSQLESMFRLMNWREGTVESKGRGYYKFPAGAVRVGEAKGSRQVRDGTRIEIVANASGFRGPDFQAIKADGVLRVVTLGASSTYGYSNLDDETYPALLEGRLSSVLAQGQCGGFRSAEVLNLGIPHLRTEEIRHLLEHEGLALDPDIVTFYEGANEVRDWNWGWRSKWLFPLRQKSLAVHFATWVGDDWLSTFSAEEVALQIGDKPRAFAASIAAMRDATRDHGAVFLALTQQCTARWTEPADDRRGQSYEAERAALAERLESGQRVSAFELTMLLHGELMDELRRLADAESMELVDVVRALDDRRDWLTSWVHLSAPANERIAELLATRILASVCSEAVVTGPMVPLQP